MPFRLIESPKKWKSGFAIFSALLCGLHNFPSPKFLLLFNKSETRREKEIKLKKKKKGKQKIKIKGQKKERKRPVS